MLGTPERALVQPSGFGLALATIAVCVIALATIELAVVIAGGPPGVSRATAVLPALVGVVYAGAGLVARGVDRATGRGRCSLPLVWPGSAGACGPRTFRFWSRWACCAERCRLR